MATLHGKKLTPAQHTALKKKWEKEDKIFWKKEITKMKKQVSTLKKQLTAAEKLPVKVKATAYKARIRKLESSIKLLTK